MDFYNSVVENLLEHQNYRLSRKSCTKRRNSNGNCIKFSDTNEIFSRFSRMAR